MFAPHRSFAGSYHTVQVETGVQSADPRQLVTMLFDGALAAIVSAQGALERADLVTKGEQIGKAVRIVEEGLRGGLNLEAGGELAANLNNLYLYVTQRLTLANLRNDREALEECRRLLASVREAWVQMPQNAG